MKKQIPGCSPGARRVRRVKFASRVLLTRRNGNHGTHDRFRFRRKRAAFRALTRRRSPSNGDRLQIRYLVVFRRCFAASALARTTIAFHGGFFHRDESRMILSRWYFHRSRRFSLLDWISLPHPPCMIVTRKSLIRGNV